MGFEVNAITLQKAQEWAQKWRLNSSVKAFLIPQINITQLYGAHPESVKDIRAYLGVNDSGQPTLMLVGVDGNGKDLINASANHFIYDFTLPCPTCCDTTSPLY